jgi:hypothetical protein
VDIGGHPPFPTDSKQFSGNFGNLLFLVVFSGREHPEPFSGPKQHFLGMVQSKDIIVIFLANYCSPRIDLSNDVSYALNRVL